MFGVADLRMLSGNNIIMEKKIKNFFIKGREIGNNLIIHAVPVVG